ncbi:MAG: sulfotransferase [Lentisphaeraceae bacterium]|nr:sulfotransferase [Lentisphaeraceae bacterium]
MEHPLQEKPLYLIVGSFKSGTTWLQKLLNAHPRICSHGEAWFFDNLFAYVNMALEKYSSEKMPSINKLEVSQINNIFKYSMYEYMKNWPGQQNAKCIVEKTPNNSFKLPLIKEIIPDVKVIHITRDGRDVVTSSWFHQFRDMPDWFKKYEKNFTGFVRYWTREIWMKSNKKCLDFKSHYPEDYICVSYEDLVGRPGETLGKLISEMNIKSTPGQIEKCLESASFAKLSKGRKNGEEDKSSFYRKGIAGDWKNHFTEADLEAFDKIAGRMMKRLGYL